ncbi:MAG: tetratricopeptide repeat protein [Thermonemataceae bacterium]
MRKFIIGIIVFYIVGCEASRQPEETASQYVEKGKSAVLKGDCALAIKAFTKAISIDSTAADTYFNRAYCLETIGKSKQALLDYDKAITLNPQFTDAYNNRGEIKRRLQKDYKGAIKDYSKAIQLDGKVAGIYFNRGLAEVALEQHDKALADFTRTIDLAPTVADAYYNRAALYWAKDYKEKACQDWAKAYELGKESSADFVKKYCL